MLPTGVYGIVTGVITVFLGITLVKEEPWESKVLGSLFILIGALCLFNSVLPGNSRKEDKK